MLQRSQGKRIFVQKYKESPELPPYMAGRHSPKSTDKQYLSKPIGIRQLPEYKLGQNSGKAEYLMTSKTFYYPFSGKKPVIKEIIPQMVDSNPRPKTVSLAGSQIENQEGVLQKKKLSLTTNNNGTPQQSVKYLYLNLQRPQTMTDLRNKSHTLSQKVSSTSYSQTRKNRNGGEFESEYYNSGTSNLPQQQINSQSNGRHSLSSQHADEYDNKHLPEISHKQSLMEKSYDTQIVPNLLNSNSCRVMLSREQSIQEAQMIVPQVRQEYNADKYLQKSPEYMTQLDNKIIREMMQTNLQLSMVENPTFQYRCIKKNPKKQSKSIMIRAFKQEQNSQEEFIVDQSNIHKFDKEMKMLKKRNLDSVDVNSVMNQGSAFYTFKDGTQKQ